MRARVAALSMAIGLTSTGVAGCGSGLVAASQSGPATPLKPVAASAGRAVASPAGVVTVPTVPATARAGGTTPTGRILPNQRTITVADDGATVRLRVGQAVVVVLVPEGGTWDVPTASGRAVLRASASGGYPSLRPADAVFHAIRPGQSVLTSVTDARCLHSQPRCEIPQRLWRILVVVVRR